MLVELGLWLAEGPHHNRSPRTSSEAEMDGQTALNVSFEPLL